MSREDAGQRTCGNIHSRYLVGDQSESTAEGNICILLIKRKFVSASCALSVNPDAFQIRTTSLISYTKFWAFMGQRHLEYMHRQRESGRTTLAHTYTLKSKQIWPTFHSLSWLSLTLMLWKLLYIQPLHLSVSQTFFGGWDTSLNRSF